MIENALTERFRELINVKSASILDFSKLIGIAQTTLNSQLSSCRGISTNVILLTLNAFPSISAEWLMRGTGNMELSEESEPTDSLDNDYVVNVLTTALEDIHTLVELQNEKIQALEMELESYTKKANVS